MIPEAPFDQLSITESITTTFLHRKRKSSHATLRKKICCYTLLSSLFLKGSMSWNPLFGQLQIFVQDFPPFSRRLQYLFFGFRKRDNTSKKTWKSPLRDCLSALRNFPFRSPIFFAGFSVAKTNGDDDDDNDKTLNFSDWMDPENSKSSIKIRLCDSCWETELTFEFPIDFRKLHGYLHQIRKHLENCSKCSQNPDFDNYRYFS